MEAHWDWELGPDRGRACEGRPHGNVNDHRLFMNRWPGMRLVTTVVCIMPCIHANTDATAGGVTCAGLGVCNQSFVSGTATLTEGHAVTGPPCVAKC